MAANSFSEGFLNAQLQLTTWQRSFWTLNEAKYLSVVFFDVQWQLTAYQRSFFDTQWQLAPCQMSFWTLSGNSLPVICLFGRSVAANSLSDVFLEVQW